MATKKTTASKPAKKAVPVKKAAPAKKTVATKKAAPAPVKKAVAKPAAKKAAPPKKSAAAKPAKKVVPVKKATPAPKKAVAPPKKAAPTKVAPKKATPVKTAPAKKVIAKPAAKPATKTAPAKAPLKKNTIPVKAATKPSASKTVPKAAPVKVVPKSNPVKELKKDSKPVKPVEVKKQPEVKKKIISKTIVPAVPSARSEIVDAVRQLPRKTTAKPGVVIAHRKIEKKVTQEEPGLTMKEYNPSVRSLLDEPEQSSGPVYRYSDEELNEFKELITKRLDNARKELAYLQGLITRKDEAGTDDTDNRFNHMEDGSGAMEREQLSQLAGRQIQFINHLEKAMIRIENKTYGICRVTGKLIDKARLRAVPHATLSIEAKKVMNK